VFKILARDYYYFFSSFSTIYYISILSVSFF